MKKPHVLNRAMFNRGGTSAYGRGITSNLVSDEQRQRFNSGGRVRAVEGLYTPDWYKEPEMTWQGDKFYPTFGLNRPGPVNERVQAAIQEDIAEEGSSPQDIFYGSELEKARFGESDKYTTGPEGIGLIEKKTQEEIIPGADGTKEVMTDSDWMELLGPTPEQTKRTKGKAQLGLAAGALDVFSQPTIAKGMRAASPHLLKLGETATADQAARDKAILQGKVLEKVYRGREGAKGEEARKTLDYKADLLTGGSPIENFYNTMKASDTKKPKDIANALFDASDTKVTARVMPADDKKAAALLTEDNIGEIYIKEDKKAYTVQKKGGKITFIKVEYEDLLGT